MTDFPLLVRFNEVPLYYYNRSPSNEFGTIRSFLGRWNQPQNKVTVIIITKHFSFDFSPTKTLKMYLKLGVNKSSDKEYGYD